MAALPKVEQIAKADIDMTLLPYVVQDIANIIGLELTLRIVRAYAGTWVWVPERFKPDWALVPLIGHAAAVKLVEKYHGEKLDMPKCEEALRLMRNRLIVESAKTQAELAREYNLTERQIRNIQLGATDDDRQGGLF